MDIPASCICIKSGGNTGFDARASSPVFPRGEAVKELSNHYVSINLKNSQPVLTAGQPAYHPGMLIKLYIYGYLNGIRSSRKLEREAIRNLEVIWLMDTLRPSYKTIANFRKDNSQALQTINKDFILICRQLSMFKGDEVAIDGSFFKGNASKASIYTEKKLEEQLAELDKKVADYQKQLEEQDALDEKEGIWQLG